jgi:hypothetical protein
MNRSLFDRLQNSWQRANRWLFDTSDRALEEAYKAAFKIKLMEDEHFNGKKIPFDANDEDPISSYFLADLNNYLNVARLRIKEFQTSRTITSTIFNSSAEISDGGLANADFIEEDRIERDAIVLEKLRFITAIVNRYDNYDALMGDETSDKLALTNRQNSDDISIEESTDEGKGTLFEPSLVRTFNKIKEDLELNAQAKKRKIKNYQASKKKTRRAMRFVLVLMLFPVLMQFFSKTLFFGPIIDLVRGDNPPVVFINETFKTEALEELERHEKFLKFQTAIGAIPALSREEMEEKMSDKARELKDYFSSKTSNAIKNWFADIFATISFALLVVYNKKEIEVLKSFIDDTIGSLSDSAKAFIIIFITDTFVGYHSPHGWEMILQGIASHLGIPEIRTFNSLFIAIVPVFMDTVFKYWIFKYLSGQSPSAVATYKTMNE